MHNIRKVLSILYALVSAMGGLLFGYDWVVIGGRSRFMNRISELPMITRCGPWR